jgi:transposase-like protein
MELIEVKQRFIELRAQGMSFDKIAQELGKAKQTLIDWSKELEEEIANYKALELETLYESYYLLKEARLKQFGGIVNKLTEELQNRDLSDVPTDKLLDLYLKYSDKVKEEVVEPSFKTSEEIREDKIDRELLNGLTAPQTMKKLKIG